MPRSVTAPQTLRSRERSVLVVDDDPASGQVLANWFKDAGWSVSVAASCREAEGAVELEPPELLIVEERLRDGSGIDMFLGLRSRHPLLSGVVLTRQGSITDAVRAIRIGFRDYLVKPLEHRRLADLFDPPANDAAEVHPSLERVEWAHIQAVLGLCRGNISEAARRLGIHRRSLQRRLRRTSLTLTTVGEPHAD